MAKKFNWPLVIISLLALVIDIAVVWLLYLALKFVHIASLVRFTS